MSRFNTKLSELGIEIDPQLYQLALTHRSYSYEHGGIEHNERLEFLGDAVLQIVVTDYLFRRYPELAEGRLAKLRAAVVSSKGLAKVASKLQIGELIKLGRGEELTGGRAKVSILADTTEALIGAMYLSSGMDQVAKFILDFAISQFDYAYQLGDGLDPKTSLQERLAELGLETCKYVIEDFGPDHDKTFIATVVIGEESYGQGKGTSKRQAEKNAALATLQQLSEGS